MDYKTFKIDKFPSIFTLVNLRRIIKVLSLLVPWKRIHSSRYIGGNENGDEDDDDLL